MKRKTLLPLLLAGALGPSRLPAQDLGMIEGLFDEVTAVTVSYQTGWVPASGQVTSDGPLHGAATEVLINLKSTPRMSYELGLGASYLRGYEAVEPTMDLRATLRALPTISLYATREGPLSVYGGGSFGLVELWNAQAYGPSGQPWDVEARTFELGGVIGAYMGRGPLTGLFAEAGYRFRDLQSLRYTPSADEELPAAWPRSLDFSGPVASIGWQLQLGGGADDEDQASAVAPAGTWIAQRLNAAPLPALLDSTRSMRREVVHGILRLQPDGDGGTAGEWRMELNLRQREQQPLATDQSAIRMSTVIESGRYESDGGALRLVEPAAGETRRAERLNGRIYLDWDGHVLTFAPASAPGPAAGDP